MEQLVYQHRVDIVFSGHVRFDAIGSHIKFTCLISFSGVVAGARV